MKSNCFDLSRQFISFWRVGMFCNDVWSLHWSKRQISSNVWNDIVFDE
jgi:hypothetical protein